MPKYGSDVPRERPVRDLIMDLQQQVAKIEAMLKRKKPKKPRG